MTTGVHFFIETRAEDWLREKNKHYGFVSIFSRVPALCKQFPKKPPQMARFNKNHQEFIRWICWQTFAYLPSGGYRAALSVIWSHDKYSLRFSSVFWVSPRSLAAPPPSPADHHDSTLRDDIGDQWASEQSLIACAFENVKTIFDLFPH